MQRVRVPGATYQGHSWEAPQYCADEVVSLFYPRWGTSSVHASYAPEFPVGMAGRSQHGGIDIGLRYVVATKVAIPKPQVILAPSETGSLLLSYSTLIIVRVPAVVSCYQA
jgi:hypothetical protein